MDLFDNIEKMWFGTERKMTWIDTPNTGAAAGSIGSNASTVLLGGGGSVRQSVDSHKGYQFSWGESADQRLVSLMESYRNGSYGRGLLYFSDPMYYRTNVLPKRHADPSMAVNWEAEPLVRDVSPTAVPQVPTENDYPVDAASYPLPAGFSSQAESGELFIPIPPGFTLALGAVFSGAGAVYARTPAGITNLTPLGLADTSVANHLVTGQPWARIGLRNQGATGSLIVGGMTARLAKTVTSDLLAGPWYAGEGHSGCRFDGDPTVINYSGVAGGRIGLALNLKEVGAWE